MLTHVLNENVKDKKTKDELLKQKDDKSTLEAAKLENCSWFKTQRSPSLRPTPITLWYCWSCTKHNELEKKSKQQDLNSWLTETRFKASVGIE